MKKLLAGVCMMFVGVAVSNAIIIVSGDANIGNGIDGSFGAPIGDNGRFFGNILGSGTRVVLQEGYSAGSIGLAYNSIANYYTGHGAAVDAITTAFTSSDLAGARLLISAIPLSAYTPAEISLMSSFLGAGNTVFFIGENNGFAEGISGNGYINAALSSLGSSLSLVNADDDPGAFFTATGSRIAAIPLTAGVNSFAYAAVSEVSGGTPLFFTTSGAPFVAVEGALSPVPDASSTGPLLLLGLLSLRALRSLLSRIHAEENHR